MNMLLSELLKGLIDVPASADRTITGLANDSRQVQPQQLFLAYPGTSQDGRDYITAALAQGANAVLSEGDVAAVDWLTQADGAIPHFQLPQLASIVGPLAARFYGYPAQQLTVIGITGTNGKTSISHFLAQALSEQQYPCGIIGTLGYGFLPQLQALNNTTPDAITLQKLLAGFRQQGAEAVAMEVSSHSLSQDRVSGIDFSLALFTNLTRDHLDYHKTIENYAAAKRRLFDFPNLQQAILNLDDPYGRQWAEELASKVPVIGYTLSEQVPVLTNIALIQAKNIQSTWQGSTAEVFTPWGEGSLHTRLLGRFNISNLLAVLAALGSLGIELSAALTSLARLTSVNGRMQTFGNSRTPLVVVDYAHTPDALEQALIALRGHTSGKLWCIFGCGGDRDAGKRPMMGKIAAAYADSVILTNDNPRHEDPLAIIAAIRQGIPDHTPVIQQPDRHAAIALAIQSAQPGDMILIAGKGHENYQIIGEQTLPFSDSLMVQQLLREQSRS